MKIWRKRQYSIKEFAESAVHIVEKRKTINLKALSAMLAVRFDMTRGLAISNVQMLADGGYLKLNGEEVTKGEEKIE